MKIVITGGGCREYIDSVRFVTNSSSGRTSAQIADALSAKGHEITLITAKSAMKPHSPSIELREFETGAELASVLKAELTSHASDAVIHAAAVSDYVPETVTVGDETIQAGKNGKLHSGGRMTVMFRASPKIADSLHEWAAQGGNASAKIVCFKLTSGADESEKNRAVTNLLAHSKADFVVYNDLSQITASAHPFKILNANGECVGEGRTNESLAEELLRILNFSQRTQSPQRDIL